MIAVYAAVRSFYSKGRECHPTMAEIAEKAHVSIPTIKRMTLKLRKDGFIEVDRKRENYYTFPNGQWVMLPNWVLENCTAKAVGNYVVLRSFDGSNGCTPKISTVGQEGRKRRRQYLHNQTAHLRAA